MKYFLVLLSISLVLTFTISNTALASDERIASPLKQIAMGVSIEDVVCRQGLLIILNANSGNPACVKESSADVLVQIGWATWMEMNTKPILMQDEIKNDAPVYSLEELSSTDTANLVECEMEIYDDLFAEYGEDPIIIPAFFTVQDEILYMNGDLTCDTPRKLEQIVNSNPQVHTIVLQYVPGSLDDDANLPLTLWIREQGLNTHLESTSDIASGGVDFFLSGVSRTMVDGAKIGVHSWSDGIVEAKDIPKNNPQHEIYSYTIEQLLGTDEFYWFTIYAASADDIYYMTNAEIIKYGLLTEPIRDK